MKFCVDTKHRGWKLQPKRSWNGHNKDFRFRISGKSDSNFATCVETRKSVTGYSVDLEGTPVAVKSGMQKIVALSVTEAELIAMVMLYVKKLLESMELKVELPMIVKCDNKGAVDLVNGWSVSGNAKHSQVRTMFVRELKEQNILRIEWIPTHLNEAVFFTKNTDGSTFNKHVPKFCGKDMYQSKEGYQTAINTLII